MLGDEQMARKMGGHIIAQIPRRSRFTLDRLKLGSEKQAAYTDYVDECMFLRVVGLAIPCEAGSSGNDMVVSEQHWRVKRKYEI